MLPQIFTTEYTYWESRSRKKSLEGIVFNTNEFNTSDEFLALAIDFALDGFHSGKGLSLPNNWNLDNKWFCEMSLLSKG